MTRYIDADALFKAYERTGWYNNADRDEIAEKLLLEQPTVEAEPHWIPCGERLPRENEDVLVSYREKDASAAHVTGVTITSYGSVCFGCKEIHALKEWRQPFLYFHANYEVVAWMPLPKPYEVEDEKTD